MNIKIKRTLLLNSLNNVSKVINYNNILNALKGVMFKIEDDKIILIASNGVLSIKEFILFNKNNLIVTNKENFIIKPNYLINILKKIDSDFINLEYVKENNKIIIKTNNLKMELNTINESEFPKIDIENLGDKIIIPIKELKSKIHEIIFASDSDNKRMILNGVNFNFNGKQIFITATDSYRLAHSEIIWKNNFNFNFTILAKVINDVLKILNSDSGNLILYVNPTYIVINYNTLSLKIKKIQGDFPNVQSLIPEKFSTELIVDTKEINKIINRMEILNVNNISTILLNISEQKVNIRNNQSEIGYIEESLLNYKFNGKPLEISFNLKFLKDAINAFDTKKIVIRLNNHTKPALITSIEKDWMKQLILPIRTF